jgi:sigma-54 dependent transcriptional regulator, acetoin dehydrogenase operon transcriptional activator AcoR
MVSSDHQGDVGASGPPASPRLSASWRRSEVYGAPHDAVSPAFTGSVDDESLFFDCGRQVLGGLHESLAGEPVSIMLTNADGVVLVRFCAERSLVAALDDTYLAPGFAFSEREAGTNGLGLALADRAPSLVRGAEHYCTSLRSYTCAAVPVTDLVNGRLLGSVNLTTWSDKSDALLLPLAQTAAGHTAALMLARGRGAEPRPAPRGEVFRVYTPPGEDAAPNLSEAWVAAARELEAALAAGASVGVVGEAGVGKAALLTEALRRVRGQHRILHARPPDARGAEAWLALWTPELGKPDTSVIAGRVDALPSWAADELATIVAHRERGSLAVTALDAGAVPAALSRLVDLVVELPPLRHRREDVLPLTMHFARRTTGRAVRFTPAAARALNSYDWPGNAEQLRRVVRDAANRASVIDVRHLAPEVLCSTGRVLSRIETVERDEIVRCLAEPGMTVTRAAHRLGISRATAYRRVAHYGIQIPD